MMKPRDPNVPLRAQAAELVEKGWDKTEYLWHMYKPLLPDFPLHIEVKQRIPRE